MRTAMWASLISIGISSISHEQQVQDPKGSGLQMVVSSGSYTVQGTTPEREHLLRDEVEAMQPVVPPYRILFVPHWQYIYATRIYHLRVPRGMISKLFTHLPSRSIYVDSDYYVGDTWLGYWIAHELGHLERNNADEREAEKAAGAYRWRLMLASKRTAPLS